MGFEWGNISDLLNVFEYSYADKEFFWLFLFIPVMLGAFYFYEIKKPKYYKFSTLAFLSSGSSLALFLHALPVLRILAVSCLIVSLARPQDVKDETYQSKVTEGIDIILAIDVSTSMDALDLKPDRLGAAKEIAKEFVKNRPNDRIGLVAFDGEAVTQCPLTTDQKYILSAIDGLTSGMITDGTAIGNGLMTSVNRLRETKSKSKVIILLTDGKNTHGNIDPITAADVAAAYKVRVYTIAVGRDHTAPYRITDLFGRTRVVDLPSEIDTKTLSIISEKTNAQSYRAKNTDELREVYAEIDKLEKDKVKITRFRIEPPEKFHWFALLGLFLLLIEYLIRFTVFKSLTFDK